MGMDCPHCSKTIDNAIPKSRLDAKQAALDAANDEKAQLANELKEAKKAAKDADTLRTERDELLAWKTEQEETAARTATFDEVGIDPAKRDAFAQVYKWYKAENGDEAADFAAWLAKDAREHVLLADHFPASDGGEGDTGGADGGTPRQGASSAGPQGASTTPPPRVTGPAPGERGKRWTPQNVRSYLRSPEYLSLPVEKQREIKAQIRAETGHPTT